MRRDKFISELEGLVHPIDGRKHTFVMFKAYLDESGIHRQAHSCVVAGYSGGGAAWKRFDRRWNRLLKKHGATEFHSQRFWSYQKGGDGKRASPYDGWPENKCLHFEEEAFSIIEESKIFPIAAAVPNRDWMKLPIEKRQFLAGADYDSAKNKIIAPNSPAKSYFLALLGCIWGAVGHTSTGEKVHFFLDQNNEFSGYAVTVFNKLKQSAILRVRQRLGSLTFASSEETSPIQAADILAYHFFKHGKETGWQSPRIPNPNLDRLLAGLKSKHDLALYDTRGLKLLMERVFESAPADD